MWHKYRKLLILIPTLVIVSAAISLLIRSQKQETMVSAVQTVSENAGLVTYKIHDIQDYLKFAQAVNEGNTFENCEVQLCSDLDFSGIDYVPSIGTVGEGGTPFLGKFDGNGYLISGIDMCDPENYVGLFANLGGTVQNVRMADCQFWGEVCGAIAADTTNAAILNCYVDAQVQGETCGAIVGKMNGNLLNCVASWDVFAGELQRGEIEHCYLKGCEDIDALNKHLYHISGCYEDTSFCRWDSTEEVCLSAKKADLLQELIARLNIGGVELKLKGYYSPDNRKWSIALPAGYGSEAVFLEARTSQGGQEGFTRNPAEDTMIFTWEDIYYPIDFLCADNIETLYVTLEKQKTVEYVHKNKEEEIPGIITVIDTRGDVDYAEVKGFYGHGNDSWTAEKKSYNVKLESYTDLLGMGENDDFVLLAGYRDNSLMSYVTTAELVQELEFPYAPEFRLVNLYVAGEYFGVYFLTEKIEIDTNRVEISSVYEETKKVNTKRLDTFEYQGWSDEEGLAKRYYYNVDENPEDITGGYLLEADVADYGPEDSRFVSKRRIKMTMKRARYSSEEQVNYMWQYWTDFENALFNENGVNEKGKHYSEYIDMESFAMQWLFYELEQEGSMMSSIYYYKESDLSGDGLLHAMYPWDIEHSYLVTDELMDLKLADSDTLKGYWKAFYQHEDFRQELSRVWKEKYVPALEKMLEDYPQESESGLKNLKWYQEQMVDLHMIENSRWKGMYPWNRIGEIEEFLEIRLDVLSEKLQ